MENEIYTLACDLCDAFFASTIAFPKLQICPKCRDKIHSDADVTMDCTKCKAHIEAETLRKVGKWLNGKSWQGFKDRDVTSLIRGEMPK